MSEPIVFISRSRVKAGKAEDLRRFLQGGTAALEADKPRTLAFLPYLNADATELTIVHVFGDAEAMNDHLAGAGERSEAADEYIETASIEILGRPSDGVIEAMRGITTTGAAFDHDPEAVGGFLRFTQA